MGGAMPLICMPPELRGERWAPHAGSSSERIEGCDSRKAMTVPSTYIVEVKLERRNEMPVSTELGQSDQSMVREESEWA